MKHSSAAVATDRPARSPVEPKARPGMEQILSRQAVVTNPQGIHARPADLFVKLAKQFQARVEVVCRRQRVDGKSILDILTLAAEKGTELTLEASGVDAAEALEALGKLIESDFGENPSGST